MLSCVIMMHILDHAEGAVPLPAGFQGCAAWTVQAQQGQESTPFPELNIMQYWGWTIESHDKLIINTYHWVSSEQILCNEIVDNKKWLYSIV